MATVDSVLGQLVITWTQMSHNFDNFSWKGLYTLCLHVWYDE